jgi:transcription elongation GreA/GreB family factor
MYVLNRNRKELAKLRHERNKAEIEKENELANGIAQKEIDKAKAALKKINEAERRIQDIDERLAAAEAKHAEDTKAIDRMRWGDLPRGDQ